MYCKFSTYYVSAIILPIAMVESGLILEFFTLAPKNEPNHYPEHLLFSRIALRIVIWYIVGDGKAF